MDKCFCAKPDGAFAAYMLQTMPGLRYCESRGVGFFQSPLIEKTGLVRHGFTTRKGGVSRGCYAHMNLSMTRTDGVEEAKENYALAAAAMDIDVRDVVLVDGVHGVNVKRVYAANRGDGLSVAYGGERERFDAMVCDDAGVALATIHADCAPLFVVDVAHRAIGLCHAGWRGTADGIGTQLLRSMREAFNSAPHDLVAMIGPHIGPCCFEVDEDVARRFDAAFAGFGGIRPGEVAGKYFVDLTLAMAYQLYAHGVPARRVNVARLCTCCNQTLFHSYRRDGRRGGAMASFLQLL
jgi:YfiH family protein